MPNKILPFFDTFAALTITLASLASSTAGVGRQSDIIDNSTNRYKRIRLSIKIKQGTSPTSARAVYVYGIRGQKTGAAIRTDGAGATDAGLTILNATLLGVLKNKDSGAATGDVVQDHVFFDDPGPEWGIVIVHDTGVNLDSTGGNHVIEYRGEEPEVQ